MSPEQQLQQTIEAAIQTYTVQHLKTGASTGIAIPIHPMTIITVINGERKLAIPQPFTIRIDV